MPPTPAQPGCGIADPAVHLRRLEGLAVGADASQGLFEGARFVHPELGFTLRFPDGWTTQNGASVLGALAPDRRMQITLEIGRLFDILRRHRIQARSHMTMVNLALMTAEGLGKRLDPSLQLNEAALPYLAEALGMTAAEGTSA